MSDFAGRACALNVMRACAGLIFMSHGECYNLLIYRLVEPLTTIYMYASTVLYVEIYNSCTNLTQIMSLT